MARVPWADSASLRATAMARSPMLSFATDPTRLSSVRLRNPLPLGLKEVGDDMLRAYLDAAMRRARYDILPNEEGYYGEIPGLNGVWANASTLEACREELLSALEDWVVVGLQLGHDLPEIDGIALSAPQTV